MSNHPARVELVESLIAGLDRDPPVGYGGIGQVPAAHYQSPERLASERDGLFGALPIVVAHSSELAAPGACMTVDTLGAPVIVARAADGELRAFRNACRHRATRLANCAEPCTHKAFVCRYHGWTYDLDGSLLHVPHEHTFPGIDKRDRSLAPAYVEERHGFVWVALQPFELDDYLAEIDDELATLHLGGHHVFRRATADPACNWKLIMDAFLENYHIRTLHRDTVYPYFLDGHSVASVAGAHIRSASARRTLLEMKNVPSDQWGDLRRIATPTYSIFPNTTLVLHPDYTSIIGVFPVAPDHTRYVHTMLVPEEPRTDKARAHYERSFDLIENGVFRSEDLFIAEQMQLGMTAGADDALLFGGFEQPAAWFHDEIARRLDGKP
jgi:phenylpropionate dioxygenase-like ring-hydroxylating dioxygenase large terminal subunit